MTCIKRLILGIVIITFGNVNAQDYDFKSFTTKDGLPHNYINDIYQDSDGFIWLATRNGICRYDGYNFKNYSTTLDNKSVIPSFSQKIFEDNDGKIWVFGPNLYAYYFDGNKFSIYSDDYLFGYPDGRGGIWFVNDSTLIKIDLESADIVQDMNIHSDNLLRLICKEKNNKVWVFRDLTFQDLIKSSKGFYNIYKFNKHQYTNSLFIDSQSNIWISTSNNGLIRFDSKKEKFRFFSKNSQSDIQLTHNYVYSVSEIDNNIWIGTMDGIDILNTETEQFTFIQNDPSKKSSISDDAVTCFLKDRTGVLFIGTRYGLNLANKRKFYHYYKIEGQNSIVNNNVHGFIEDELKNIWIISSGGLDKLNVSGKFSSYPVDRTGKNSLTASPISITSDEKNNFWIGTWQGGLFYFDRNKGLFKNYTQNSIQQNTISQNSIMALFRDSKNDIWIGTWGGGLNLYNKETDSFISYKNDRNDKNSLSDNEVSSFAEDEDGRLWIGTTDGLNLLVDKGRKVFKRFVNNPLDTNSLSNDQINALFANNNLLWVGTSFGLNRINLSDFSIAKFTVDNGLPSNRIKAISNDDEGNLWVSTNKGLAKIEFENGYNSNIKQILSFSASDGLQDEEFLERSAFKLSNGDLLFGGTNGFNRFNPSEILSDTITPQCSFTRLLVDNKEIKVGDVLLDETILTKPFAKSEKITLSYKHKSFAIEFSGLHFLEPDVITYKYMLKGFDKEWKSVDSKHRLATYTNINKGIYEFVVYAANGDKLWGNQISITIEIIPPFWRTTWFTIIMYLFIAALFYLFIELRLRIIKKQKRTLEDIVEKRTSEIREQKNNIEKQKEEINQQAIQIKGMNELLKKHNLELKGNLDNLSKARVMQKLLDYVEFKKIFEDEDACENYLMELKWGVGFSCIRCGNSDYSVEDHNSRRCRKCNYKESITSGTIFHHLRFPIDKALYILIVTSTGRKINISKMSRTLDLRLKTVWNFHNKVKEELSLLKSPIKSDAGWTSLIITPKRKYK